MFSTMRAPTPRMGSPGVWAAAAPSLEVGGGVVEVGVVAAEGAVDGRGVAEEAGDVAVSCPLVAALVVDVDGAVAVAVAARPGWPGRRYRAKNPRQFSLTECGSSRNCSYIS